MTANPTRREWLAAGTLGVVASVAPADREKAREPFGYMLNMSTIRGQTLDPVAQVEIAAKAGYNAVEPWLPHLDQFVQKGGDPKDLAKRIRDLGLTVESAIGFAPWIVNDEAARKKGLEQAKRDMDAVAQLGGKRLAAPPVGAHQTGGVELMRAAERYGALLELGDQMGVVPQVEVWGSTPATASRP
jgi:sugar phosphate isomerase/epimerase